MQEVQLNWSSQQKNWKTESLVKKTFEKQEPGKKSKWNPNLDRKIKKA